MRVIGCPEANMLLGVWTMKRRIALHTTIWIAGVLAILASSLLLFIGLPHSIAGLALSSPVANPIVLGPLMLDNPPLLALEALLAIGLACLPAAGIIRQSKRSKSRAPRRSALRAFGAVASSCLVFLVGAAALFTAFITGLSSPYILPEASPSGARIIVVDRSFLLVGKGDVYYLPPYSIITEHIGHYSTDDGYNPVAHGDYSLAWRGEEPAFSISGASSYGSYYPDR